jgi:hypothetical protein
MFKRIEACATLMSCLLALAATSPPGLSAQEQDSEAPTDPAASRTRVFVSSGLGGGTPDFGGFANLTVSGEPGDLILRVAESGELNFFSPGESLLEVALLYGRRASGSRGWTRVAAGIGYVRHSTPGDGRDCAFFFCSSYEIHRKSAPGLAIQMDAVWAPSPAFGLGVTAGANLNAQRTSGSLALGVHLGRVR